MAKIDKSQYTKDEWKVIRNERRIQKSLERNKTCIKKEIEKKSNIAFVLGNGTSRKTINPDELAPNGKVYGCNALYRSFRPDYLIAVDVKMILEINKSGFQHSNEVWTNPNRNFSKIQNLNYFSPSKGWSSGPTALWLSSEHNYETIFILGFDYKGLDDGKILNNIYADTMNYKKSTDGATFFGNWMRQTKSVIQTNPDINYVRVIAPDNYSPEELNTFDNYSEMLVDDFKKIFNLS
jgi:hypothetical protein